MFESKYRVVHLDEPIFARSISLLWWKRIYVGRFVRHLSGFQRAAVIAHEEAHCRYHHSELRILTLLLAPFLIKFVCHWTEFSADRYATRKGLGYALATVLNLSGKATWLYPSATRRVAAIKKHEMKSLDPRKGSFFARTA